MTEIGMEARDLLAVLLELAEAAELEVRVLSAVAKVQDFSPTESAACRVGARIWVVLSPDDPVDHQAEILAGALSRFRSDFLEARFVAPAVRDFIERVDPSGR
ncbi:MAG: hypothetical protein GY910_20315 [bacterium]|nr:hypothetical protein [Deltaproteobacteria bacterium]MCP4907329.1 hypothetical protein [bacterium]